MLAEQSHFDKSKLENVAYYLNEVASVTFTGTYSINLISGEIKFDRIGKEILSLPLDEKVEFKDLPYFFDDAKLGLELFQKCANGKPFLVEAVLIGRDKKKFWARGSGKPVFDDSSSVIGIRGVFTSINRFVNEGEMAKKRLRIIRSQNERLLHFAHIVSHNIRSHASNLQLTLETFDVLENSQDTSVAFNYIKDISKSLNRTLEDLNKVVTVHTQRKAKEKLSFEDVFTLVLNKYQNQLDDINVTLNYDFSNHPTIYYVPSFLESIFDNLISNAIKYRSDNRLLMIDVYLKIKNNKPVLYVEDNGIGIDMKRHKKKIFKMYSTFHENFDSTGVGLFIVKNQVESLDGTIKVKSELNKGSKFIISF